MIHTRQFLLSILQLVGSIFLNIIECVGVIFRFAIQIIYAALSWPIYGKLINQQLINVGYYSLPVVGLTTLFSGMVIALQTYAGFSGFGAEATLPRVVSIAMIKELVPVLAGLMLTGRVGAAMTAELGIMRVTEQIDALYTLGIQPIRYLIVPRIIACTIALPILVILGDSIGIFGGYIIAVHQLKLNGYDFIDHTLNAFQWIDFVSGIVKATVFGFLLSLIGCYFGFYSHGGAIGVGEATTNSVVVASILILITNYFITGLFFNGSNQ